MQKLPALTTLRFFAAAAIVFFHFEGRCGVVQSIPHLDHAVSFFFVLSGFILAYVYPSFQGWTDIKKFYVARIARIWPAHMFFFLLVCLLASTGLILNIGNVKSGILNVFLMQAWVPIGKSYFSFNSPSWSISTEFFFYLCFPFIISNWSKTWMWKVMGCLSVSFLITYLCSFFQIPIQYDLEKGVTGHGLIFINPLARIIQFTVGIWAAHLWLKYKNWFDLDKTRATLLEMGALIFVLINMKYYLIFCNFILKFIPLNLAHAFQIWMGTGIFASGTFALLIMILSSGKGVFSQMLSFRFGILLGEISFSIYLFHQIIYRFYLINTHLFEGLSNKALFLSYWALLLGGSFLVWKFIENPSRKFIMNLFKSKQKALITVNES